VRGFILVPMMLAFSQTVILVYLVFVTLHATWTHCNCRLNVSWLEPFLVMPRYHHWHHTSQKEAIDKNFAIHFPWIGPAVRDLLLPPITGRRSTGSTTS
jgi:sterol desaturase/sphingolipid hydroxylase (fatty acid hydroxylase superfamily)